MNDYFLRPPMLIKYPPGNYETFEMAFYNYWEKNNPITEREYLPVFWTNILCNRNFDREPMNDVQDYLNNLDKNKKYFTIVQYDDLFGKQIDVSHLDLLVFSHVGKGDIALPVINRINERLKMNLNRDFFCSFVGPMDGRHEVRKQMRITLSKENGFFIKQKLEYGYFVDLMNRSIFSLCPRGYANTSFRINEALFFGSIPIYIYDNDPIIPFDKFEELEKSIIFIHVDNINSIPTILKSMSKQTLLNYQENGKKIWNRYFKYKSCYNEIIKILKEE